MNQNLFWTDVLHPPLNPTEGYPPADQSSDKLWLSRWFRNRDYDFDFKTNCDHCGDGLEQFDITSTIAHMAL